MDSEKTGILLQKLRTEKGLTQKELAEAIGVTDKAVSRWETGRGFPDLSCLQKISDTFGLSINELLAGERAEEGRLSELADKNIQMALEKENKVLKTFVWLTLLCGVGLLISLQMFYDGGLLADAFAVASVLGERFGILGLMNVLLPAAALVAVLRGIYHATK